MGSAPPAAVDLQGRSVWAIDTLSRVYQLFHALPEMTAPDGRPVSAVYGMTRDLLDIIGRRRPDFLLAAMDAPGPTFRHERYSAYKATRAEMPADLVPQIDLVRRLYELFGVPCLELRGFEADDLLATVATRVAAGSGECVLATSDKDARQLLGPHVHLLNLRSNKLYGPEELQAEWGIGPEQVVDFLALVGDAVDNVPGIPGIGPKIASELLQRFGTLEGVLAHVDEISGTKRKEQLRVHGDAARAGRGLIQLECNVPLEIPWSDAVTRPPDVGRLAPFLRDLGFKSIVDKLEARADRPAARPAHEPQRQRQLSLHDDEPVPRAADGPADAAVVAPQDDRAAVALCSELRGLVGPDRPLAIATAARLGETSLPGRSAPDLLGIALVAGGLAAWLPADLLVRCEPLCGMLADAALPKVGYDLKRQLVLLRRAGLTLRGRLADVLVAGHLLDAGQRNQGLADLADRSGLSRPDVPAERLEAPSEADAAVGAGRLTQILWPYLLPQLERAGLANLFWAVEMPLVPVLAGMENRGVRIDTTVLATLSADYHSRLIALEQQAHALAGHPFSLASPVQVRTVLFDELGLPVVKRTKTGPSTDAEVLEELAGGHELPRTLLEHRRFSKLKSTYVDALPQLLDPATGRVHTSFNQTVTATGRLSSSDPNLQNIPVRTAEGQQIRSAFLPGTGGWWFVAADYSQIELRILAHLSGDRSMREAFTAGEDIHARTAAAVFGVAPTAVTSEMRRTAKAVNFGILYGQSAFGLAKALGIPQAEAAAFIAAYFREFAGAAAFMDDVLDRCRNDGFVVTMLGRRRAIQGVRDRDARRGPGGVFALSLPERTAINTVVQGSAADLIKLAMLRVADRLATDRLQAAVVLQIHDELLLEAPEKEVQTVAAVLTQEMVGAASLEVPLVVSVHSGVTWAACEKG